jgi:hypothetical protein
MPATSQQQQKLFGLALSVKRGETPRSEVSDEVLQIVDTMSEKKIKDFAETSHKGLPTKVETVLRGLVRETFRNKVLGESSRRSEDFFEEYKFGVELHKLFKGKFDGKKFDKFIDALEDKTSLPQYDRIISRMGNMVGMNVRSYDNKPTHVYLNDLKKEIEKLYKIHNESVNETFIPKVGTIDKFELKNLLMKNSKVNAVLGDSEKSFMKKPDVVVIMHQSKRFNTIFTDGKQEFEIDMKVGKLVKPLSKARKEIVAHFSKNESVNEAKVKPKNEMGVRLVKAIDNNINDIYDLVFSQKKDVTHVVNSFQTPLLNSIKQTIKYNYKPHPTTKLDKIHGGKSNEEMIKIFQTELKKLLPLVEKMIKTPTKVEVKKVTDMWRNIWNFEFGGKIGLSGDLHNSIIEQVDQLDEKLITYSNRAPYGQVVFIAGGAGGGKGFAVSNFLDSASFKVRDVDEMKKQLQKLNAIGKLSIQQILDRFGKNIKPADLEGIKKIQSDGYDLKTMDLKKPDHVYALHILVKAMDIKDQTLANMLGAAKNPEVLPNIMFDITAKEIADITDVVPQLLAVGYKPNNIHLAWVLANYQVAIKANQERDRVVPADILLKTHIGAGNTIWGLVTKALPKGMNGRVDVILNNRENTIPFTEKDEKTPIKVQARGQKKPEIVVKSFLSLPVKKQGSGILPETLWKDILFNWIKDNAPKELTANM